MKLLLKIARIVCILFLAFVWLPGAMGQWTDLPITVKDEDNQNEVKVEVDPKNTGKGTQKGNAATKKVILIPADPKKETTFKIKLTGMPADGWKIADGTPASKTVPVKVPITGEPSPGEASIDFKKEPAGSGGGGSDPAIPVTVTFEQPCCGDAPQGWFKLRGATHDEIDTYVGGLGIQDGGVKDYQLDNLDFRYDVATGHLLSVYYYSLFLKKGITVKPYTDPQDNKVKIDVYKLYITRGNDAHKVKYPDDARTTEFAVPEAIPGGGKTGADGEADALKEESERLFENGVDTGFKKRTITIRELKPNSDSGKNLGPTQLRRYAKAYLKNLADEDNPPCQVKMILFLDLYERSTQTPTKSSTVSDHSKEETDGED